MGLCFETKSLYYCKLKCSHDVNLFDQMCRVYFIDVIEVNFDQITIECYPDQLSKINGYCKSIYPIRHVPYIPSFHDQ